MRKARALLMSMVCGEFGLAASDRVVTLRARPPEPRRGVRAVSVGAPL